jgi:hypothetical protein
MTYSAEAFDELAAALSSTGGVVLRRGDAALAAEVTAQNLDVVHDPEIAVGAASEADVAAAVRFAAAQSLPVRVLATGHGSYAPVTDGVLITTRRLTGVRVDPQSRVATIAAGEPWSTVVTAGFEHGLVPVAGASSHVGTVGYTTGGGLGPLARAFGVSSDWARGFRVVTAGGEAVRADASEHPDLFWALRGGKGGFGVVTSMDFELVPLTALYGGSMFFDTEHIETVLRAWVAWTHSVPEQATSSVAILRFPPLEVIPEPLRGKTAVSVRYAYVGDADAAAAAFQPIRDAAPALFDMVGEMPADQISTIHNDPTDPGPFWDRGLLLDDIDDEFATALLGVVGAEQHVPLMMAEVRHIGGATERDVPGGSAVGGRSAKYTFILIGAPDPSLFETVLPGVAAGVLAAIAPWTSRENTVNFAGAFALPGSYAASWPADVLTRLTEVRASYDPSGLFPYGPATG